MLRIETKQPNRRHKLRFALQREVTYKVLEDDVVVDSGTGKTINIGSGGVAFSAAQPLKPGALLQLAISWPVLVNEGCSMRLVVFGRVLRSSTDRAACTVDKYEFRTQARIPQAIPAVPNDFMLRRWAGNVRKESARAASA